MKNLSVALKAHYALTSTTIATCWKATLRNGTVVAATSHDRDIVFSGVTYLSVAAYTPTDIDNADDLSPDNLELEGLLRSPAITDTDIYSGLWDYAAIEMFEVNFNDLTMGRNLVRAGTLGQVRAGKSKFAAELRGLMQAYSRRIVRLTTKECTADLGDARCTINLALFTYAGEIVEEGSGGFILVDSIIDNRVIGIPGLRGLPPNWLTGGLLTFTTGLNAGLSMEVKSQSGLTLELQERMPFALAIADQFTVTAGCMKRLSEDCIGKFNNVLNFRGFPYLPGSAAFGGPGTVIPAPVPAPSPFPPPPSPSPSPPPPPAPPPPPPAPAPAGALPARVLGCYFTVWETTFNITQVPLSFNLIYLFNAQPVGPVLPDGTKNNTGDGTFALPDLNSNPAISPANIQIVRARGQRVLLSCGGAGAGYNFTTRAKSQNFVNSVQAIITAIGGVDGLDFNNFEAGIGITTSEMIWIAQQLRALYGSNFILTAPPSGFNTGGAAVNDIAAGSGTDLNAMGAMRDAGLLDYAGPQFYDWNFYKQAGVVSQITDQWVARLDAAHVVVGLSAEYNFANALTLAECQRELTTILAAHPTIRGAFCWTAQTNLGGGNVWGAAIKTQIGATPP